jgi:hypothetical protein
MGGSEGEVIDMDGIWDAEKYQHITNNQLFIWL